MLKEVKINGLRGFSTEQNISFSIPNDKKGSGLTVFVGGNNTGKTTIIEAIKYFNFDVTQISFSVGKRNIKNGSKVSITYVDENEKQYMIHTKESGGSQVEMEGFSSTDVKKIPFILPSRRSVQYEISGGFYESARWDYMNNENMNTKVRKPTIDNFQQRMFNWVKNKEKFDQILYQVLDKKLKWYIDQNDNGNYYLAFREDEHVSHTSEGIGDGIWSIFTIVDALYDAEEKTTIVIDEPELSLHPQYQKKILELLLEESKNKQIIISTHSPYFISWEILDGGGCICRTLKQKNNEIKVKTLSEKNIQFILKSIKDFHNPHLWGIDTKELFFLEDNVIVVEGQEDVISFNKIMQELKMEIDGNFFGWGAGGAEKIEHILSILSDLGYENVFAIYDGDKTDEYEKCKKNFPQYCVKQIWEDDIRDKPERTVKNKNGILDKHFAIKDGTEDRIRGFLENIQEYFIG